MNGARYRRLMRSRKTVPQVKNRRTTRPNSYRADWRTGRVCLFVVIDSWVCNSCLTTEDTEDTEKKHKTTNH